MSNTMTPHFTFMPVQRPPSNLDTLPLKILAIILQHVFPVARTVKPFFSYAMSLLYIRGYSVNDEHAAKEDNIDISFLLLNRSCYELGTKILYGTNYFRLENREWTHDFATENPLRCRPDIAKWWFTKIGERNLRMIKRMTLFIESGWVADRRDPKIIPSPFESSYEEHWLSALHHIFKIDIKLNRLKIVLFEWNDLRFDNYYRQEDKDELNMYRKRIIDLLQKFRGQKRAVLEQQRCTWISHQEAALFELKMRQEGRNLIAPPAPKMSLGALIEHCRRKAQQQQPSTPPAAGAAGAAGGRRVLRARGCARLEVIEEVDEEMKE